MASGSTTRVVLDVDRGSDPVSGRLWPPGNEPPLVFTGWIQLVAVIEELRIGGGDRTAGALTNPTATGEALET